MSKYCHQQVRYSNKAIVAILPYQVAKGPNTVPDFEEFYKELNILLDNLRNQTALRSSPQKFAAASRPGPNFEMIYAFEQCTPDITPEDCVLCLKQSALIFPQCCVGKTGVRILLPSCYLRFDTFLFYNETKVQLESIQPILVPPASGKEDNGKTTQTVIIVAVPIVACLIIALSIDIFLRMKQKHKPSRELENQADNEISTVESLQYDFGTIRTATNDFSDANKLGQGGFSVVYKGKLPNGNDIAVKRLSQGSVQGDLEFKNEVLLVVRLQHRSLVRLLGFSLEGSVRLLIFELVKNGSLDHFIFDSIKRSYFDWDTRFNIIKGIARGLLYLHEESRLKIIHRDLKASNVLLDEDLKPKISDFGMARLLVQDETQGNTSRIVGTYGYMAPEYILNGKFSIKSDVFSFGVLVLEIVTGQRINNYQNGDDEESLLSFAWRNWDHGTIENMMDPALRASGSFLDIVRCIHICLLCVQEDAYRRPTMGSVVLMFTMFPISLPVPSQPAFFMSSFKNLEILNRQENSSRIPSSINDVSINHGKLQKLST